MHNTLNGAVANIVNRVIDYSSRLASDHETKLNVRVFKSKTASGSIGMYNEWDRAVRHAMPYSAHSDQTFVGLDRRAKIFFQYGLSSTTGMVEAAFFCYPDHESYQ